MSKYAYLVMVTGENNNKYYEMKWDGISSNFDVTYGRNESTATKVSYPISQWEKKFQEKVKKGYKDKTHIKSVTEVTTHAPEAEEKLSKIEDSKVELFIELMQRYTKNLVSKTYKVKYQDVTQAQVDNAQKFIDRLRKTDKKDVTSLNNLLLELYMEIPRYMGNVKDYLMPNINLDKTLQQEQDNLDAMAAQVAMYQKQQTPKKADKKQKKETKTLLDLLGVKMKEVKVVPQEVKDLVNQVNRHRVEALFEATKPFEDERFDKWMATQKNKQTKLVYHGTKNVSVIPIIEQGLKIRPSGNFQFTGKVYGDGNYFSEEYTTSIGYAGYDADKVMLIYEVHVGNPYTYGSYPSLNLRYSELQKHGYDCTYLKGSGGRQQMVIAYNEPQCKLKYILWLK